MAFFETKQEKEKRERAEEKRLREMQKKKILDSGKTYLVKQIILKEALIGVGSTDQTLASLEDEINIHAECGYRLHTCSTESISSKGIAGGDRVIATLVFEKL